MNQVTFSEIEDNLAFLDDWEERYRYLIELGNALPVLPDELRTDANKVSGCVSQVWVASVPSVGDGDTVLAFQGDSDAMIVKGIVAVLIALYSGKSARWIAETDAVAELDRLGLREHLTAQRSNGLISMVKRMRADAEAYL